MKKALRISGITLAIAVVAAQFVGPSASNPPSEAAHSIFTRLETPPVVAAKLQRSCGNCHSNQTKWVWYNKVAPVSWWTIDHVNHGRSHLNFSEWGTLPPKDAAELLEDICKEIESGAMPLPSYLWMHGEARLSSDDRKNICLWTVEQRNKLLGKSGDEHEGHRQ